MEEKQIVYKIRFHFDNDIVSIKNDFKSLKKAHKTMKKLMKKKIISFEETDSFFDEWKNTIILNKNNINYITIDEEEVIQF